MVIEDNQVRWRGSEERSNQDTSRFLVALSGEPLSRRKGRRCYEDHKERVMSMQSCGLGVSNERLAVEPRLREKDDERRQAMI
jgi:hypothetical protein